MRIKKRRNQASARTEATKRTADEGLAWAAGSEQFRHRDPLYHVTESFQQTFDRIGRSHALTLAAGFTREEQPEGESERGERERGEKEREDAQRPTAGQGSGFAGRESGEKRLRAGNVPAALTKFSDTAFKRGAMSASVLNGTGKMMLVSCLKRTAGQSEPKRIQQQDLLETGSQVRNIPGRSPGKAGMNRPRRRAQGESG